jgi:dTDP-4-dehydrorhamnose reductase
MARIMITGGSGRLGTALQKVTRCWAPTRRDCDITNYDSCALALHLFQPDVVIHCAGFANSLAAETHREECHWLNVKGTRNMADAAQGRRFVYVSTDYVFDGKQGNYSEADDVSPVNWYGETKAAGEEVALSHDYALVLRAPFRADPPWGFARAFTDQWTSCDWATVRAWEIMRAALMVDLTGILHIGSACRSIYEMANSVSDVGPMLRAEVVGVKLPRDTSLDSSKWHRILSAQSYQHAETLISA